MVRILKKMKQELIDVRTSIGRTGGYLVAKKGGI
jgi:hypothetical protein